MKTRYIHVMAHSDLGARIHLTLSEDTDDLRHLISKALLKISNFNTVSETFLIDHIDSVPPLHNPD